MADLTALLRDLEKELTCSICNEIFTDPKTLPCLHSYCRKCVTQLYENSEEPEERSTCPKCKTQIDLFELNELNQHSSFYLDALLKLLQAIKNTSSQEQEKEGLLSECVSCENRSVLVAFCPQCNGMICEECATSHKAMKQLRDKHQATMLDEFKQENVVDFIKRQMFCMEAFHKKNDLQYFFCKEDTCRRCVCKGCFILTHRNHDMATVEEAAEQVKITLKEEIVKLDKVKEVYEKKLSLSKQNMTRIRGEVELAKLKIDEEKEVIIKRANDHAKIMNEALDELLLDQGMKYQEEQNNIHAGMAQISDFQARCQILIENDVAYDILEKQKPVQQRIKDLSEYNLKPVKRLRVQYKTRMLHDCFGSVVAESVVDPSRSSIESLKKVRECFLNEFEIVTRNSDGTPWYAEESLIDVTITEDNDEREEVDNEIIDEENGKYRVRYRAAKAVSYEIRVNIDGKPIKNSPRIVNTINLRAQFNPFKTFGEYGIGKGKFQMPRSIAIGHGWIAIADCVSHRVQIFSLDGKFCQEFGSKGLEGGHGELNWPFGVVFKGDRILVSDQPDNGRIQEFDLKGSCLRTVYSPKEWFMPRGMCVTEDHAFAVCCWKNEYLGIQSSIKLFGKEGGLVQEFSIADELPLHITFCNRKYYVSFVNKNFIRVFNKEGGPLFTFRDLEESDSRLEKAYGLSVYGENMILVCNGNNQRVELYTKEGQFVQSFGSPGSGIGQMLYPLDVVASSDSRVFVLESEGKRVHVWK